jgi:hypothetical protein
VAQLPSHSVGVPPLQVSMPSAVVYRQAGAGCEETGGSDAHELGGRARWIEPVVTHAAQVLDGAQVLLRALRAVALRRDGEEDVGRNEAGEEEPHRAASEGDACGYRMYKLGQARSASRGKLP